MEGRRGAAAGGLAGRRGRRGRGRGRRSRKRRGLREEEGIRGRRRAILFTSTANDPNQIGRIESSFLVAPNLSGRGPLQNLDQFSLLSGGSGVRLCEIPNQSSRGACVAQSANAYKTAVAEIDFQAQTLEIT